MGGAYKLGFSLVAQSLEGDYCAQKMIEMPDLAIEIRNEPGTTDILPPVVESMAYRKPVYGTQDTVEIIFEATDATGICSAWKAQNGYCSLGTHVEWESNDGEETIAFHVPTPVFELGNNRFMALVPLSAVGQEVIPGSYKLTQLMLKDVHDNFYHAVAQDQQAIIEIQ